MTLKEKSFHLLKANEKLESDLIQFVDEISRIENAHLAWCQTYYDIRLDDLEGVIYHYYQKEIDTNYKTQLPKHTIKFVLAPLNIFISIASNFFKSKSLIPKQSIWLSSEQNTNRNRYRHLINNFKDEKICYYNASHTIDINIESNEYSLNFSKLFKFKDLFVAFASVILLKVNLNKNKNNSYVALWVKNQPWTHFFNMAIREIWVDRAIKKYKPKSIFFTTANTYSPARLMSRLAKLNNITFIIVACRPMFTILRPEERACELDLNEVNDARIADFFIVWDLFSKKTLLESKINSDKIYISQPVKKTIDSELVLNDEFIVLLTHETKMNDLMIDELLRIFIKTKKIVIRTHPLCKLTNNQYKKLNPFEILDISNFAMNSITFNNCIAISINSTAAVEACSYGCGIIWIPYLNERSVIFEPIMSILGSSSNDTQSLKDNISELKSKDKKREFITICLNSYKLNFSGNDSLDVLFKELNITQ